MAHSSAAPVAGAPAGTGAQAWVAALTRAMAGLNRIIVLAAALALIAASAILSYSVLARLAYGATTYWQDEVAVFLLVGATFMTGAHVQALRGHVGIELLAHLLPARINAVRLALVDIASLAFCAFFTWKSFALLQEAWVDGQVTSSTWAPPLWIPYSVMTLGMGLLSAQIALQIAAALALVGRPTTSPAPGRPTS